jgi:hypothetical protein
MPLRVFEDWKILCYVGVMGYELGPDLLYRAI